MLLAGFAGSFVKYFLENSHLIVSFPVSCSFFCVKKLAVGAVYFEIPKNEHCY